MRTPEPLQRENVQPSAACRQSLALRLSYGLTQKEATVAKLLCLGYDSSKLATRLSLSKNTVRTHIKRIFCKTHTHRQADLVRLLLTTVFSESPTE